MSETMITKNSPEGSLWNYSQQILYIFHQPIAVIQ